MPSKKKGGVREGAGRPRVAGIFPAIKSVKLSKEHWELAKEIGGGNMSEGLRRALDSYTCRGN